MLRGVVLAAAWVVARPALADPCPAPAVTPTAWHHAHRTPAIVSRGVAGHSAKDAIVAPGESATLSAKFAYGPASLDLEEEEVVAFVQLAECGPWREVGRGSTDRDGRLAVPLAPGVVPGAGHYDYRMVVRGDASFAAGTIWVLPPRQRVVVFDIDGTLTTGDEEMIREVLLGTTPAMAPAANDVARAWAAAGVQPVYLTGRPYVLDGTSRRWLASHDFPPGPVITADRMEDAAMGRAGVGRYKRAVLRDLQDRAHLDVVRAYGNADTDICAYAEAGIAPESTFIIGPLAGRACDAGRPTQALRDYRSHLATLTPARAAPAPRAGLPPRAP